MSGPSAEFMTLISDVRASRKAAYNARMDVIRKWFEEKINWILLARSNDFGFHNELLPPDRTVYDDAIMKKLVAEYMPILIEAGFIVSGIGEIVRNSSRYDFKVSWDPAGDISP